MVQTHNVPSVASVACGEKSLVYVSCFVGIKTTNFVKCYFDNYSWLLTAVNTSWAQTDKWLILSAGTRRPLGLQLWTECSHAAEDSWGPRRAPLWPWDPNSSGPRRSLWNGHDPGHRSRVTLFSGIWTSGSAYPFPSSSPTVPTQQVRLPLPPPSSLLTSPPSRLLFPCSPPPSSQTAPPGGRTYDRLCPLYL